MEFDEIFRQFLESRRRLKVIFVGSSDESGQPNCSPKLLIDIVSPNKLYYIDHKSSRTYRNVHANWLCSAAFMSHSDFTGYRMSGFTQDIDSGREFEALRETWSEKVIAYEAERMVERIKGIYSGQAGLIHLPEDFVIEKFIAEEAAIVSPDRVLSAALEIRNGHGEPRPATRLSKLQARIAELEQMDSRHQEAEEELRRSRDSAQAVLNAAPEPICVIDKTRRIVMANEAMKRALGGGEGVMGGTCFAMFHHKESPCQAPEIDCPYTTVFKLRREKKAVHYHYDERGQQRIVEESAAPVLDEKGEVVRMVITTRDITEKVRQERELEERAAVFEKASLQDDLTGLYNRRAFVALAEQQVKLARRSGRDCFLIFSDVDGLKPINDTFGHRVGDQAIAGAADILRKTFRDSDIIARIGGDEFVVAALDCKEEDLPLLRGRLKRNIEEFNRLEGRPYPLDMSSGVARCGPADPASVDELLSRADKLMYEEKQKKGLRRT